MRQSLSIFYVLLITAGAEAQSLADRIARAEGTIRLSVPSRAGVCGNGRFIGEETATAFRTYTMHAGGFSISQFEDFLPTCHAGPIRLALDKTSGAIGHLRAAVGAPWRPNPTATDLGTIRAADAASWLLDLAPRLDKDDDVRIALMVASLTDSVRVAERLIGMVRDRTRRAAVRREAMRWLRGPAEREGQVDAADRALRDVVGDARETVEFREFALRRLAGSRTQANASWIRDLALDRAQPLALRERAVRTLGDELARPEMARALYARLDHLTLKERVLRTVAEGKDGGAVDWMRELAGSAGEPEAVRDRAIRLLGEHREFTTLRTLYPRLDRLELRERVIRVVAEMGIAEGARWLEHIVLDASDQAALRERAVRVLAEHGATTADLVRLYDRADQREVRVRLIRTFAERGDRASLDKLSAIIRNDPDPSLQREAQRRVGSVREEGKPDR